uniref:Dipeptidyl-peptidase n=1 Tax=Eiseniibacteriota bacterium TaxID=2212470 RepID=A0A832I194_UNCEI
MRDSRSASRRGRRPLATPAALAALVVLSLAPAAARADEGMWTLDRPPLKALAARYGFTPPPGWLERMRGAAVNFGGGSGAFVSPEGLVVTNQHVARGAVARLSRAGRDLVAEGYAAATRADELPCPGLDVRVLVSTEDVTARVRAAADSSAPADEQDRRRRAEMARIERASTRETGLESRVVELHHGGAYWLHRYRVYSDVRLVWVPEEQAASHGGDPDNFGYPRHDLDVAFFRVYENGSPVRPVHWLPWRSEGPSEGELVFTFGHPGSTHRFATVAQLAFRRDVHLPLRVRLQERRLAALRAYAARGAEEARQASDRISALENNLKRERAYREVLADAAVFDSIVADERRMRARVAADARLAAEAGAAWDRIEAAQREAAGRWAEWLCADLGRVAGLLDHALAIVRAAEETARPNEARWSEYREQNLPALRRRVLAAAPSYPALDEAALAAHLAAALETLGPDHPFMSAALEGRTPAEAARAAFAGTALGDTATRRRLWDGGRRAVEASRDPLVRFARRVNAVYRELRAWHESRVASVLSQEGGALARARFALLGDEAYPDATGTLRLGFGKVAGYPQLTSLVPWKTNFYSLYGRTESFDRRPPFDLPQRWLDAARRLDLATPLNFVSTNDIIGGSSGSPVVDREGRLVGIVFDGNVQAFRWDVRYDDAQARCVSVHPAAVVTVLREIAGLGRIADELEGAARR